MYLGIPRILPTDENVFSGESRVPRYPLSDSSRMETGPRTLESGRRDFEEIIFLNCGNVHE